MPSAVWASRQVCYCIRRSADANIYRNVNHERLVMHPRTPTHLATHRTSLQPPTAEAGNGNMLLILGVAGGALLLLLVLCLPPALYFVLAGRRAANVEQPIVHDHRSPRLFEE
jgi:hypothetical protein